MKRLIGLCFLIPLLAQGAASVISQPSTGTAGPGGSATNVYAASILDSTAAGQAMLTALNADAQWDLLTAGGTNEFNVLVITNLTAETLLVGATNVTAQLALKANAADPTTTGTFTHNGTNIVVTSSNLTLNVGKANALVIGTNGNVGVGVAIPLYVLQTSGTLYSGNSVLAAGVLSTAGTTDSTSGTGASGASINSSGGIFATKGIRSANAQLPTNAVPTAAAMGANTATTYFGANKWWLLFTDPSSNIVTGATIGTNGIMAVNGLQMNQSEMQPFDSVTNYVIDLTTTQQRIINATNLVVKFLHATNVVAGGQKSVIVLAGTNATVRVELPRPLWICNTNLVTLAANQAVTISMTGYGSDNTNVIATVGPVYSR